MLSVHVRTLKNTKINSSRKLSQTYRLLTSLDHSVYSTRDARQENSLLLLPFSSVALTSLSFPRYFSFHRSSFLSLSLFSLMLITRHVVLLALCVFKTRLSVSEFRTSSYHSEERERSLLRSRLDIYLYIQSTKTPVSRLVSRFFLVRLSCDILFFSLFLKLGSLSNEIVVANLQGSTRLQLTMIN